MDGGIDRAGGYEIIRVLALALVGLLLAVAAAFAPWYSRSGEASHITVVDVRAPDPVTVHG